MGNSIPDLSSRVLARMLLCGNFMSIGCATLCHLGVRTAKGAFLLTLLATGCGGASSSNGADEAVVGGASGAGGVSPGVGAGGVSGKSGAAQTAGAAGVEVVTDCTAMRTYPNCGICQTTLEEYCNGANSCQFDSASLCTRIWWGTRWQRGCGYVRVDYWGDVHDYGANIWDEASGRLVYHWYNGMLSMGCMPETRVGTEPTCDQWTDPCPAGGAGAGGAAGT